LVSYSEQFDNAYWSKYLATVTADTAISPDGTQNADLVYPSSTGSLAGQLFRQISSGISSGNVVTISAFVKASGKNFAYLSQIQNSFSPDAYFNLTTGAITNISSGVTASMTQLTNSWWRISITSTAGAGSYYAVVGSTDSAGSITNTASGTNGILVYGYQVEVGAYSTSYIPTTSSSATRVADACFKTGISSLIGSTTGSVFVDFEIFTTSEFGGIIEIINTSSTGQRLLLWENASTSLELNISGGIGGGSIGTTATIGRHKAVFTYTASAIKFFLDGVKIGQTTPSTLTGGFDKLDFEHSQGGVFIQKKNINQALVFTSELTEAEAIALTTI